MLFLGVPAVAVIVGAFQKPNGGLTMNNIDIATQGVYLTGFENSFKMALVTALIPAVAGTLVAYAIHTSRGTFLRRVCVTASGVFANFGGVPLAFMFIATLGLTGIGTQWLNDLSINLYNHGFTLYSFEGVALVYMYFQIPLMVLVTLPAFEGLKLAWREAAENLGAHSWQYWRHVGIPVLMPAILGSTLLVFGFGLSAYATADSADGRDHSPHAHPDREFPQRQRPGRPGKRGQSVGPRAHRHKPDCHDPLCCPAAAGVAVVGCDEFSRHNGSRRADASGSSPATKLRAWGRPKRAGAGHGGRSGFGGSLSWP